MIPSPGWVAPFGLPRPSDLMSAMIGVSQGSPGVSGSGTGPAGQVSSGQAPTGPAPSDISGISGFNPSLVSMALSSLGAVPGSPFGLASKGVSLANSLGALPGNQMTNAQGFPVSYEGPKGLMGLLASVIGLGQPPSFTVHPIDELGIPAMPYEPVVARQFSETAPGATTSNPNAPHGWFSLPGQSPQFNFNPPSPKQGIGVDEGVPALPDIPDLSEDTTGMGFGEGAGGGGGGGASHLCTLMYDRQDMDRETWVANGRFRASMGAAERRGYDRWAKPLARWLRGHHGAYRTLHGLLGWLPRAYMKEIRRPGSSRLGQVLLTGGLWGCRWLGSR